MADLLQYNITDWHQLTQCHSNLSRDLSIKVSSLLQNDMLTGTRIAVVHELFGPIFTTVFTPTGSMVWSEKDDPQTVFSLTTDQILMELHKWGFIVTYQQMYCLPEDQLAYIVAIQELGYTTIRTITPFHSVLGQPVFSTRIVAFVIASTTTEWIDITFKPRDSAYTDALTQGQAIDLGSRSKSPWDWAWLTSVVSISSILAQNGGGPV